MSKQQPPVIPLAMSPVLRALYFGVAIFSIFMGLASLGALSQAEDSKEQMTLLTGVAFFGGGGVFTLLLVCKKAGHIELTPRGVLLDTYIATGLIEWDNLSKVAAFRILGMSYLGLKLNDLNQYLKASEDLDGLTMTRERSMARGMMGIMLAANKMLPMNTICTILGWPELPKSGADEHMFAFNGKAFGYHVLLQSMWLPKTDQVVRLIEQARAHWQVAPVELDAEPEAPATLSAGDDMKECPMCAEQVRAAAKICRYCRYSFERQSFVA